MTTLKTNSLLCIGVGAFGLSIICIIEMATTLLDKEYGLCMIWSITGIGFGTLTYLVGDYMEYRRNSAIEIGTTEKVIKIYQEKLKFYEPVEDIREQCDEGESVFDEDSVENYPGNDDMESP